MIDIIKKETKKIIFSCCKKHAEASKLSIEEVQLVLGLNENGNTYTLCERYIPKKEMTILQVLDVRIDFTGRDKYAPAFIAKSLVRFSNEYSIPLTDVKVMCIPTLNEQGKPDVKLYLYNGDKYIQPNDCEEDGSISFDLLFQPEDLLN
jgi:hypothetical protein